MSDYKFVIPRAFRSAAAFAPMDQTAGRRDVSIAKPAFQEFLRDYLDAWKERLHRRDGVLFCGPNGTGKSWTAVALARTLEALVGRDLDIIFVTAFEVARFAYPLNHQQDRPLPSRDDAQTFTEVCETSDLLILDDLGHEFHGGRDIGLGKIKHILRHRLHHRRMTFVTSNLRLYDDAGTPDEEMMPKSILSMLKDICTYQLEIVSEDNRQPIKRMRVEA